MNVPPLVRVQLQAGYGPKPVLNDIRFELQRGEVLGLVGTSGAGKSTLVLSMLGLLPWRGGSVRGKFEFEGRDLLALPERKWRELRGRRIALIPQSPMTALNSAVCLRTHFREAWKAHEASTREFDSRLRELLEEVQLPADSEFLRKRPTQISVGQAEERLAAPHRPSPLNCPRSAESSSKANVSRQ